MTSQTTTSNSKLLSTISLGLGIVSIILILVFLTSMAGPGTLIVGGIIGLLGIIFGAVALAKRHAKGLAVTGIILSAVSVLASLAVVIFAFIFVGAFIAA